MGGKNAFTGHLQKHTSTDVAGEITTDRTRETRPPNASEGSKRHSPARCGRTPHRAPEHGEGQPSEQGSEPARLLLLAREGWVPRAPLQ